MAVTEIALLQLKSPIKPSSTTTSSSPSPIPETLLANLQEAAISQACYSRHPVTLVQCLENSAQLYLIGGWDSISQHVDDWIPSETNQRLLKLLSKDVEVKFMFHLNCEPEQVNGVLQVSHTHGGVVALERYVVEDGEKEKFDETSGIAARETSHSRRGDEAGGVCGFRLDKGYEAEDTAKKTGDEAAEFVMFSLWESVDAHTDFIYAQRSRQEKIYNHSLCTNVRYGRVINLAETYD